MNTANLVNVDRASHELRCGREVNIDGTGFIHPEYMSEHLLEKLQEKGAVLVITKNRAHGIFGKEFRNHQQIALKNLTLDNIHTLLTGKKQNNFELDDAKSEYIPQALELARIAQLLPAAVLFPGSNDALKITAAEIREYQKNADETLEIVSTAPLKLCDAKNAKIKAFRSKNGSLEHMAIIIGNIGDNPLIRVHSSCYTGDLLGSLSCDCGDQLRGAIKLINNDFEENNGGGIILYLMQEGRGIGLVNKLHAYELQAEAGLDTVEANEFLGFEDEERSFEAAAVMLKKLGIGQVRVITNNPKKITGLEALGIKVNDRVPMVIRHEHNHAYLEIKSKKSGHII